MTRSWRRRALFVLLAIAALLAFVAAFVAVSSQRRLQRDYAVTVEVSAPDPALAEQGRHLARSRGCTDCHGDDLAGKVVIDEMPFGRIVGDDLTRMPPGHENASVHERMFRALHHGVDLDSRPLLMMPSQEYTHLSAREIEAIAAYVSTLKPIDHGFPQSKLGPVGRALLAFGKLDNGFISADLIDHAAPAAAEPPPLGTVEYGHHLAQLCTGCHRADYAGGPLPHGPPGKPPAANLTPHATGLSGWSERDFIVAMRTGKRPDGTEIDGSVMPWRAVGNANDEELKSLWLFLRSLPPIDRSTGYESSARGGSDQSIGAMPRRDRYSFAAEKCPLPRKPRCADNGDGCVVFSTRCRLWSITLPLACA